MTGTARIPGIAIAAAAAVAAMAGMSASPDARAQQYANGSVVRCESKDGRTESCAVGLSSDARLVRQLSDAACVRGRTWGTDARGIWVSGGCRAEFTVATDNGRYDRRLRGRSGRGDTIGYGGGVQVLRCESNDKRNHECAANVRSGVTLQRQLSGSPCIEGRTWGWNRRGIWVDQGCRAEFAIR